MVNNECFTWIICVWSSLLTAPQKIIIKNSMCNLYGRQELSYTYVYEGVLDNCTF